jgi:hypothetical protein
MGTLSETISEKGEALKQREGKIARAIEKQAAKLPSDVFLWSAIAAMVGSLFLEIIGLRGSKSSEVMEKRAAAPLANFVGMWVPTLLLFGLYNKIVKVAGSDRVTH